MDMVACKGLEDTVSTKNVVGEELEEAQQESFRQELVEEPAGSLAAVLRQEEHIPEEHMLALEGLVAVAVVMVAVLLETEVVSVAHNVSVTQPGADTAQSLELLQPVDVVARILGLTSGHAESVWVQQMCTKDWGPALENPYLRQ